MNQTIFKFQNLYGIGHQWRRWADLWGVHQGVHAGRVARQGLAVGRTPSRRSRTRRLIIIWLVFSSTILKDLFSLNIFQVSTITFAVWCMWFYHYVFNRRWIAVSIFPIAFLLNEYYLTLALLFITSLLAQQSICFVNILSNLFKNK